MSGRLGPVLVAAAAVLLYSVIGMRHLDAVPPVHEDEPWQASVGARLATDGALASDLMAGYHGMERHYFGFMPLHPLLLAAVFRCLGVGLVAARCEAAALGLATLLLTGLVARRLCSGRVAALAMVLLVALPWAAQPPYRISGIPLLDQARIARYDIGVPVFGLLALLVVLTGTERRSGWRSAAAGALAGAAGLSHVYGFFWLPALLVLALWNREPRRCLVALAGGAAAVLAPYALLVLTHLPEFLAQTRQYGARFRLGQPGFYLAALHAEVWRWGLNDLAARIRPGGLVVLLGLPAASAALLARGWRTGDRGARAVVTPLVVLTLLVALLVVQPERGYLLTVVPLAVIALAWGGDALWRRPGPRRWLRPALVLILAAVLLEGGLALARLEGAARTTTPYRTITGALESLTPSGATVLLPTRFGFGFPGYRVRSWWVPFALARPAPGVTPVALSSTIARISPDVVIVDEEVATSLAERPQWRQALAAWAASRDAVSVVAVDDPTYGRIVVWR